MKEKIIELVEDIIIDGPDNLDECNDLIDGGYLDSMDLVSLIMDLNEAFDINITASDLEPKNFNSVRAIEDLIRKLS